MAARADPVFRKPRDGLSKHVSRFTVTSLRTRICFRKADTPSYSILLRCNIFVRLAQVFGNLDFSHFRLCKIFHGYLKIVARRRVKVRFEKYGGVGNEMVEGFCRKIFKTVRMEYLAFETWKISIAIFIISKRYIHIYFPICVLRYQTKWRFLCVCVYIYISYFFHYCNMKLWYEIR